MAAKVNPLLWCVGCVSLLMAGVFLLLSAVNLRSIIYYNSPISVYRALFAMSLFCALSGVGVLMRRKWALIMLFLPGILVSTIFVYAGVAKGAHVPMPWALLNMGFVLILLGPPASMLRCWHELRW